jgi:hypothetical protein
MIQADLWGNATVGLPPAYIRPGAKLIVQDLSLLVDLKYEDLQKLQAVGAEAQAAQAKMILRNDLPRVWEHLKSVKDGRVDIVLDNGQCWPLRTEASCQSAYRCQRDSSYTLILYLPTSSCLARLLYPPWYSSKPETILDLSRH